MTVKSAFFSGKRWRVVTDEEIDGYADAPPGVCEQAVDGTARDVARFLWRLGYRLK
jgi:hypothetical protein